MTVSSLAPPPMPSDHYCSCSIGIGVRLRRNQWLLWIGKGGRLGSEPVSALRRNQWNDWAGISVRNGAESAGYRQNGRRIPLRRVSGMAVWATTLSPSTWLVFLVDGRSWIVPVRVRVSPVALAVLDPEPGLASLRDLPAAIDRVALGVKHTTSGSCRK